MCVCLRFWAWPWALTWEFVHESSCARLLLLRKIHEHTLLILSKIILSVPHDLLSSARRSWAQVGKWHDESSFSSGFIMLRSSDKSCVYRVYLNLKCVSMYGWPKNCFQDWWLQSKVKNDKIWLSSKCVIFNNCFNNLN